MADMFSNEHEAVAMHSLGHVHFQLFYLQLLARERAVQKVTFLGKPLLKPIRVLNPIWIHPETVMVVSGLLHQYG